MSSLRCAALPVLAGGVLVRVVWSNKSTWAGPCAGCRIGRKQFDAGPTQGAKRNPLDLW